MTYNPAFLKAVDHVQLYEVGGFWNVNDPAVPQGLIDTYAHRRAVGYTNDPNDNGGETKFGVAKSGNPDLDITDLTWAQAQSVYFIRYWLAAQCDKLHDRVAALHFDGAVNHGIWRENMFLQRAVGVTPDGVVGPVTLAKTNGMNDITVCNRICDQREQFYRNIVVNNPSQARYLAGWLRRVAEVRAWTTGPGF